MKKWFSLPVLFFYLAGATAQTVFWSDTFEDTGAPSSGVRTPEVEMGSGGPPYVDYFIRATNADLDLHSMTVAYTGFEGAKFWAGEDHDNIDGVDGAPPDPELQIDWTGIDISGKTNLQFTGRFAANPGNFFDNQFTTTDYVIVEYSIDGGPWSRVIAFFSETVGHSGPLKEDTNGDNLGDGTTLSSAFQEFTKSISGTGNTIALRLRAFSDNGGAEEWAVDHFRLAAGTPLPVELTRFEAGWEESAALLTWETGSEHNNLGFAIERSLHYGPWTEIGFVPGAGDSQRSRAYRFIDAECLAGELNYYRLRQTDIDGAATYSDIRSVKAPDSSPPVGIYPNPAREKLFFTRPLNGPFEVIDPAGRVCRKGEFREAPSLDLPGLHPGIYFLSVRSAVSGVRECLLIFQIR